MGFIGSIITVAVCLGIGFIAGFLCKAVGFKKIIEIVKDPELSSEEKIKKIIEILL